MTSREYFDAAASSQRRIDGRLAAIASMREREGARAQRYGAGGGSGASDPMRAVDARMDAEREAEAELASLRADVEDARRVCAGIRRANPSQPLWGDAIELHWLDGKTWFSVALDLGVSERCARTAAYAALDWVDMVGIAAAREGCGQAALL